MINRRSFLGMAAGVAVVGATASPTLQRVEVEHQGRWVEVLEGLRVIRKGDHFRTFIRDPEMLWQEGVACEDGTLGRDEIGNVCGAVEADLTIENGELVNG